MTPAPTKLVVDCASGLAELVPLDELELAQLQLDAAAPAAPPGAPLAQLVDVLAAAPELSSSTRAAIADVLPPPTTTP